MANEVLTYSEIANRIGVSIPAAKMRAKRNAWGVTRGNDGKVRVTVPSDALSDARPPVKKASGSIPKRDAASAPKPLKIMQDRLYNLRQQLDAANVALDQANAANAEATAERTRLLDDARRERESLHSAIKRLCRPGRRSSGRCHLEGQQCRGAAPGRNDPATERDTRHA